MKNIEILDCTLRDGGYYNNWNFGSKLIQEYLSTISKLRIKYVELGFRTIEKNKIRGPTAYTSDNLINNLKIPKEISIGVMVNASDLFSENLSPIHNCKKIFSNITKSKIKFVRFACHYEEVFSLKNCIGWLKKNNIIVCINIMQISEISRTKIRKVCNYLKNTDTDILYLADSLGSLNSATTKKIVDEFSKNWNSNLGLHAHNNLGLAFKNSIIANKNGVKWIDSTITGMGRGPGNLKTEEILKFVTHDKETHSAIDKLIRRNFIKLKNKHKWGPNKYYALAARNKIHPTYIQKLISDKRYNKMEYLNIINILKKTDAKKFNPYKLINSSYFLSPIPKGAWKPRKTLYNKKVLIIGPGDSVKKCKKEIQKFIIKNDLFVIGLNTVNSIEKKLINLRVACHPMRILSDAAFHKKSGSKLAMPYSMISRRIRNSIALNKNVILDYGLRLKHDKKISIKSNYCTMPYPLAVGYSLSIALSGFAKKIYFAGLDGYTSVDTNKDNTSQLLKCFQKKYFKSKLTSLTPTNYNSSLKLVSIN